ncbi:hypothetical protein [Marinimicrobium agarilyticum]|uniref:hypothetical protein n=1 Tax=Marinimicrobium agarilyticum TaxID=306546 RepID=UPI000481279A|nr:hypothetical protein [Marinimicrobium agarilyticum]
MKKLSVWQVVLLLTMISACKSAESQKEWCVPEMFLAPSNFISGNSRDTNFDEPEEGGGPTLFFPAEYLAERVSGYEATVESSGGSTLKQPMHVSISSKAYKATTFEANQAWRLTEGVPLYSSSSKDEFGWDVFVKGTSHDYSFWGQCYDDFEGGFTCMRTFEHAGEYLTYNVDKVNVHSYTGIDELLGEKVAEWRCK